MITNGGCTVFNKVYDPQTRLNEWKTTSLNAVLWTESMGGKPIKGGMEKENSILVFIPFTIDAVYKSPTDFLEEPEGVFTLRPGDKLARNENLEDAFTIVGVETFDYGSRDMRHWEVTCQ